MSQNRSPASQPSADPSGQRTGPADQKGLTVRLPVFEGPLDLLLHLIEKNKVDIYDIPIVEITRQYLEYLKSWDQMNLDVTSEFIVMASRLINMKARKLLPLAQQPAEEEEEDEQDLIRRLVLYRQYKQAAGLLRPLMKPENQQVYLRDSEVIRGKRPLPEPADLLRDISLEDLYQLCARLLKLQKESYNEQRGDFSSVEKEQYPVSEKIAYLEKALDLFDEISFCRLRQESHSKEETITYFMAMLELSRMSEISLSQEKLFGDIIAVKRPPDKKETSGEDQAEPERRQTHD